MKLNVVVQIVLLSLFLLNSSLAFGDCLDYSELVHAENIMPWLNNTYDVSFFGNTVVVSAGDRGIFTFESSNVPVEEFGYLDLPSQAMGISIFDKYALIANWENGLQVVDISNPLNPVISGTASTPYYARSVATVGNLALVACFEGGVNNKGCVTVFDMTNPAIPDSIGNIELSERAYDIAVLGTTAYVSFDYDNSIGVLDLSNPTSPETVSTITLVGLPRSLHIIGSTLYVASGYGGVFLYDVSVPNYPEEIAHFSTNSSAQGVQINAFNAFVSTAGTGVEIYDISDLSSISYVNTVFTSGVSKDIKIDGQTAYVVGELSGLCTFDISKSLSNPQVSSLGLDYRPWCMEINEGYAYITDSTKIDRIDISDLTDPSIVSSINFEGLIYDFDIQGNYLYVTCGLGNTYIVELGFSGSMVEVGNLSGGNGTCIDVNGELAYQGWSEYRSYEGFHLHSGFRILDVSSAEIPFVVSEIEITGFVQDVVFSDGYVYLACDDEGLVVVDVTNHTQPVIISTLNTPGNVREIVVMDQKVYLADGSGGIITVDVSDPTAPGILGTVATIGWAEDLSIIGNYCFVSEGFAGFQVFDLSLPPSTSLIGGGHTGSYSWDIQHTSDYLLTIDELHGMVSFPIQCGSNSGIDNTPVSFAAVGVVAYPNPFNPQTTIQFHLSKSQQVRVSIFSVDGKFVKQVFKGDSTAGIAQIAWDGTDNNGSLVASGVYLVSVEGEHETLSGRMCLVR